MNTIHKKMPNRRDTTFRRKLSSFHSIKTEIVGDEKLVFSMKIWVLFVSFYLVFIVMDIMWPICQSHFHLSCLCSLK